MHDDPRSLRLHPAWQWLSRLGLLVRWREWSDTKMPLFLVGVFYAVLRMDEPGIAELAQIAALFALLCFFAAFGHIINDYADRDADRAAGKKKILATWSKSAALSAVAIPAVGTIGLAVGFDGYTLALTVLAVLVAILYSLPPPARLKERGILGWLQATLAQRTLPLAIIFEALHAGMQWLFS
jgi:4-hydroxybenzoate polyprenyltransferase